ncbi:S8 family serine peptidase, partial [Lysobacter sp. 2RAB21]
GIAKQALLHPVRAGDCANTYLAPVIAAVDWVTANRTLPAVANLSSGFSPSPTLDTAIANSVASGVAYAVAAGNNNGDACNISPARAPAAMTVGAIDPNNDTRAGFSNFGTCVDLFAPGVNTLSAGIANDASTAVMSGTSMASPHVAGVAARYLEIHPAATPAAVWAAIHNADNVTGTPGWAGVVSAGAGSPNEQLHYGSLNDGVNDGDPHIVTDNGMHYDFQPGGEFVALRGGAGMEIQIRQT